MSKTTPNKKKTAAQTRKPTVTKSVKVGKMSGGTIVQGGIKAKRVVMGNQTNIKAGRDVVMRDQYNDYRQHIAQIATPQQFIAEAEQVQAQIAEVKQLPALPAAQQRRIEAVAGDVQEVIAEAKKDKPNPKAMSETLKTAAETMEGVSKTLDAAQSVGKKIDDAIIKGLDWGRIAIGLGALANAASKLFGG